MKDTDFLIMITYNALYLGPDLYHTCYCLSGLSIAQHSILRSLGGDANTCRPINPLYNLTTDAVEATFNYFADHDPRP